MGQFAQDGLVLGLGSKQTVISKNDSSRMLSTLYWFLTPRSDDEISKAIQSGNVSKTDVEELVDLRALVRQSEDDFFTGIYQKTALYYDHIFGNGKEVFQSFSDYTFYLVGAGGIGNFMGYALAMHPIRKLCIIDFDVVEKSNLNRQFLFTWNDVGEHKASLLAERLKQRNPELCVEYSFAHASASTLDEALSSTDGRKLQ